ncbi:MAG: sigma-54-dependent Fis family transcriptional regulator [Clostridiales bacterium]|nr:sigma-54-dependent Fis family transcriptional regulator [Clostridiales bacterium]
MLRKIVEESHNRSIEFGISPEQKYSNRILEKDELIKRLKKSSDLILASEKIINKLYNEIKDTHFLAVLTDEKGCVLSIIGDEQIGEIVFNMGIHPGVFMDEKSIGTNAIALTLIEDKPIQLHGDEHFIEAFHDMTCSCVPIHDESNVIIGTLDLSGYSYSIHTHIIGTLIAAGYAIEKNYELTRLQNSINNQYYLPSCFYTIPIPAFIIDHDGFVIFNNDRIRTIFGYVPEKMNVYNLISDWHKIQGRLADGLNVEDVEVKIDSKLNRVKIFISVYRVNMNPDEANYVCYFKDIELKRKNEDNVNNSRATYTFDKLIGENNHFLRTIEFAKKISNSKSTVLLIGESGTGKEIFAQSIQNYSKRKNQPFIAINCGAIPENLIESELFGYEEGAFTGAAKGGRKGKFELADGGTIFLDEIGELPYELQNRLLRVIEEETVSRIGGTEKIIDVRIIAASNKDLKEEVEKKRFRKDLYYRLNVLPIYLLPLRERKEDIPLLFDYYQNKISNRLNKKQIEIPDEYYDKLIQYPWPGNIRELQNFVELIINTEALPDIDFNHTENLISLNNNVYEEELSLVKVEKRQIAKILKKYDCNITLAALVLGIARNTLYRKIENHKIDCSKL